MSTQTKLNYDITSDKEPLYTTVDQLNQSTAAFTFTATNAIQTPVTIKAIEIDGPESIRVLIKSNSCCPGPPAASNSPTTLPDRAVLAREIADPDNSTNVP